MDKSELTVIRHLTTALSRTIVRRIKATKNLATDRTVTSTMETKALMHT